MNSSNQIQTHVLTREVLESLWDLQDLHRDLIHHVTRLAYLLDKQEEKQPMEISCVVS